MDKCIVKGITKVYVPSVDHPEVPYYILLLEDEDKKYYVKKVFEEYSIRKEFMKET